jgi:biopolymer transport protein ExbB
MAEIDVFAAVRDFVERGGNVLLVLAFVTAAMWTLIYERFWYFRTLHKREAERIRHAWAARADHSSWEAHKIREMLVSQVRLGLDKRLWPIETFVTLCPMLGLLGTVTGMIEVFDVMAFSGSGNARGMAAGVSKATLPTMAGMVASLSGMLFSIQLRRFALDEADRVEDSLVVDMAQGA